MDIELVRGTQGAYDFEATGHDGLPIDLDAKTLSFTASANRGATAEIGPIALVATDAPAGKARLTIDADDIPAGTAYAAYEYVVTLDDAGSDPVVVASGSFLVLPSPGV